MVFRDRAINERVTAVERGVDQVREQAERGLQELRSSVDLRHAGADQELREGLREVRGLNQTLRQDSDRRAEAWQEQLDACREELQLLRNQLRREAVAQPVPAPTPAALPPAAIATGVTASDDTVPMEELFTTLTAAAAISAVEIACHKHTWKFVRRLARTRAQVFDLPDAVAGNGDGPSAVRLSGPALMSVLNALHQARYDHPDDRLKREYIEEKALAHALFARISAALKGLRPREADSRTPRIVLDDAQAPVSAAPEPDEPEDEPELEPTEPTGQVEPVNRPTPPEPNLFLIDGKLMTAPYPLACVAKTTKGDRCENPLEYGAQDGTWQDHTEAGFQVYVIRAGEQQRWLDQHCKRHHPDPVQGDYCQPGWRLFEPGSDAA